jgi:hypothetical protein
LTDADAVLVLDSVRVATVDHAVPVHRCSEIVRPLWFGPTVVESVAVPPRANDERLALMLTDGATVTVLVAPTAPPFVLVPR